MTPRKRSLLVSGLVAGAALAAGALISPAVFKRVEPGREALAGARFVDLQGRARSLSEWRGKPLVANFWATWCAPCVEEIPLLKAARRLRKDLEIVGIAIDQADKVSPFASNMQIDYPILIAGPDALDLIRLLGNRSGGLPFTVFLDRLGRPAQTKLGVLRQPELDNILAALVSG